MPCRSYQKLVKFIAVAVGYQIVHFIFHHCYYKTCSPTLYTTLFGIQSTECALAEKALHLLETHVPLAGFALAQGNLRRQIYQV